MSRPPGDCHSTDEGPDEALCEARPAEPDAEATAALPPLRSETLHVVARDADGASVTDAGPDRGDMQLDFLTPGALPGSLGRFGHYEVIDRIGEGGMGLVLKARDERLDRIVALKFLKPALAGSALARRRFTREAQAAAAVCHENVVTIHAVDETSGQPYLVMQYVSGHSLQEKIDSQNPLILKDIVRIGKEVAAGLAAAHARGLVHRDIKPANILLENGAERVKITDFGLARAIDDASLTQSGVVVGTPSYMSPEQACGKAVDYRTDVFSLGSVLYAICTGRSPFQADSTVAILRKVSDEEPRPIRELRPDAPEWLVAIVSRLMAKNPALRYQSAAEVADVLAQHLADLEQPSRPQLKQMHAASAPTRRRWAERRAGVELVSVAILLVVGPFIWWGFSTRNHVKSLDTVADSVPVEIEPSSPAPPPPAMPPRPPVPRTAGDAASISTVAINPEMVKKAQEIIAAGVLATRKGDLQNAIELYTEAIRIDPGNPKHLLARAHAHSRNQVMNWPAAIADANQVLRLDPQNAEAFEARAYAEYRAGEFRRAIDDATEAIRINPKIMQAYSHRGAAYNGLNEWNHAIVDLNEYLKRAPDTPWGLQHRSVAYLALDDIEHALADSNRAIAMQPNSHHFRLHRARIFISKKDYERAAAEYAEAIRVSPQSEKAVAYGVRGDFETSLSLIDPAIADYTEAIRLQGKASGPENAWFYIGRGRVYMARDDIEKAMADFDQAINRSPGSTYVHMYRGIAWVRKRQWDRALADFDKELQLGNSLRPSCLAHRAEALALSGRYTEAETAYDEAGNNTGRFIRVVLASEAWCIDRPRGDYEAALKKLDQAIHPEWPVAPYLYRGLMYARTGQPDRAIADFARLMQLFESARPDMFVVEELFPRRLAFLLGRGEAYLLKGDVDRALADSEEAVRFCPKSAEAKLLRARVFEKRGSATLAEADRLVAMQLAPDPLLAFPASQSSASSKNR